MTTPRTPTLTTLSPDDSQRVENAHYDGVFECGNADHPPASSSRRPSRARGTETTGCQGLTGDQGQA